MFYSIFVSAVVFWAIAWYWGRRYIRAIEARASAEADLANLRSRVATLEAVVGDLIADAPGTVQKSDQRKKLHP